MREYASGEITFSKPCHLVTDVGWMSEDHRKFVLEYNEYYDSEIECLVNTIADFCKKSNTNAEGSISIHETGNGDIGEYVFQGKEFCEYWNDQFHLRYMDDELLIHELENRGYKISK